MKWPDDVARRLRVGDNVTQVVRVPRVEFKKDMIFVQQEIFIYSGRRTRDALGEDDWSVRELRTHVFRRPESRASIAANPSPPSPSPSTSSQSQSSDNANAIADVSAKTSIKPDVEVEANDNASAVSSQDASRNTGSSVGEEEIQALKSLSIERGQDDAYHPLRSSPSDSVISSESQAPIPSISLASSSSSSSVFFTYRPDSPLLFLYSALTHNPHKVHYDHPWTVHKEGHLAPLVHGPLTATLLVELACAAGESQGKTITEFEYRATSPMVIDKDIHMSGDWSRDDTGSSSIFTLTLSAEQGGKVGMKAVAKYK
ncbi:hypothetical protein I316_06872 [Kwoniella heveanensis BCC8398]|uniref:MaoC-like domain-containing protein n=1 Tax=Kwoniella heveanensis BCC8398 TaxID=1296120 RepID=A0A1B9GK95_9TREE|nr:hypothetical protein I316_06872 [Kwoniella heveanensis BCC8398]